MNKVTFHVVSHTHWDREWQKNFHEYRTRLIKFMDELIDTLEVNEEFSSFMLDGQTSLIEDYLQIKPSMYMRIKNLVERERLIIGPWYVQPDEFLPSGESLIRNLMISEMISREFGSKMNEGYLPDSFGQSRFIPQILNQFNIDSVIAMRGFDKNSIKNNEFIWEGSADSKVICSVLWAGYNNGSMLVEDLNVTNETIEFNLDHLLEGSYEGNVLLLSGSDQATVKKEMPSLIDKLNKKYEDKNYEFKLTNLTSYINKVKENEDLLSEYEGDFRKPHLQRVHRSIAGTRTDFKQENYKIQTRLSKVLEPLSTIGWTLGDRYENELINHCWKKVVQNHAHDSIGNVCTDDTHKDMLNRIEEANHNVVALTKARINNIQEKIRFKNNNNARPIIVFNLNSEKVRELVEVEVDSYDDFRLVDNYGSEIEYDILKEQKINLKDYRLWLKENPDDFVTRNKIKFFAEVKGVGYRTYYIEEGKSPSANAASTDITITENSIENKTIKIVANNDGTLSYYNKSSNTKIQNILNILDEGNAGDSYDYSPPRKDNIINSSNFKSEIKIEKINDFEAEMRISKVMEVNENTDADKRSNEMVELIIDMVIKINTNSRYFDLDVSVDNKANNHRVSLYIPNFTTSVHFREGSFGDVETSNVVDYQNTLDKGWKELCYPIYPTQRYVYDIDSELAVFNKGIQSYEITEENDLKIHLLTTMDYMGKKDLLYRPGRRSGAKIYTPDSLMIGKHEFNFRFLLFDDKKEIYSTSDQFQTNLFAQYFHKPNNRGFMSDELTAFSVLDKSVSTSALMKSQFGDGIIWRVKNMSNDVIDSVELKYNSNLYRYDREVNLLEEKRPNDRISEEMSADYIGEEYEGSGELFKTGKLTIHDLKPNEFINLKFQINKLSI